MKNLVILVIVSAFISVSASSQKNPPEVVTKEFAKKYTAAKSVKWDNESAKEWEAEFKMNGKEMSATYDNSGKWFESEAEISSKELPAAVSATLKKEFAGYKTGEMSILESPEMKGFEISLTKDKTGIEVIIDASGKVLKNTPAEKEEKK
jgi:hypothetical protein